MPRYTNSATLPRWQTAQRRPTHSPGSGVHRWHADGGAIPVLHRREPPVVSRTPGDTARPVAATGEVQRGLGPGTSQSLYCASMPHTAGSGATTSGDGRVRPAQIRPGVWRGHEPTTMPPGSVL